MISTSRMGGVGGPAATRIRTGCSFEVRARRAKLVCLNCPVRTECLAEALDNRIESGLGGMTDVSGEHCCARGRTWPRAGPARRGPPHLPDGHRRVAADYAVS